MQRAALNAQPLKPRRMKPKFQAGCAVPKFRCSLARYWRHVPAKSAQHVGARNTQGRGHGRQVPRFCLSEIPCNGLDARAVCSKEGGEFDDRQAVAVGELGQSHPHRFTGAAPLRSRRIVPAILAWACWRRRLRDPGRCQLQVRAHGSSAIRDRHDHGARGVSRHDVATALDHLRPKSGIERERRGVALSA